MAYGEKKYKKLNQQVEGYVNKLHELVGGAEKEVEKLNDAVTTVAKQLENINSTESAALKILEATKDADAKIKSLENEFGELKSSTADLLETNESLTEEIKNQLGRAAGGVLSRTFDTRKGELETSMKKWFWLLIVDILILAGVALFVFLELKTSPVLTPNFLLKLTLSFPFIYAAFFFHSQYNKDRELWEEYAFKSAVSLSLNAYREILKEEFDEEQPETKSKFLDFIVDTIKKIYTTPREIISRHPNEKSVEVNMLNSIADIFKKFINLK